ncbi:MAG: FkbM family methyltransferase [Phycisphaeraceae bacterium]|nr:FkbM family methyltransferase [Phycisphaeraceae bacterium]
MSIYDALQAGLLRGDTAGTIIEVGAHIGDDSARLRRMYPQARLICFEPDPRNAYEFRRLGRDAGLTLVEAAVSDTDGTAVMHLSGGRHPEWAGHANAPRAWTQSSSLKMPSGHLKAFPWVKFKDTAKVRGVRLDSYAAEAGLGDIELIWADTQGAEDLMIAGGPKTLARTRLLFTEFSDQAMYEGQIPLAEILKRLPGAWEVVERFKFDVLLRNTAMPAPKASA